MYCIRIKIFASRLPLSTVPELIESAKKFLGENPDERKVFLLAEFIRGTELEMEKKDQILDMEKKEQRFISNVTALRPSISGTWQNCLSCEVLKLFF